MSYEQQAPSYRSRTTLVLLSTFLGPFGAHRFYAGKKGSAIAMLILSLTFFGLAITGIWSFIDWIMCLAGSFRDSEDRLISRWQ